MFLDIKMPGMDGLEVLQRLQGRRRVAAGRDDLRATPPSRTAVEATKLGAFDFIEKPLSSERVLVTVRNALDRQPPRRREPARSSARWKCGTRSSARAPPLQKVLDAVRRAAPTNATVLITGESGVGKELVARAIHRNSLRSRERFVQVNCAAIPDDLIESELFGHEKGSFTGATEKQIGKFEQADKGTIFLDEVGDMSLKTQAKVLRVLQEGEVERLGSARTIEGGRARDRGHQQGSRGGDREGRLPRGPLLPPRRHPDLTCRRCASGARTSRCWCGTSLDLFSAREQLPAEAGRRRRRWTSLQRYRWRGNIRELRNTIERLVIMTPGDMIDVADLPEAVRVDAPSRRPPDNERGPGRRRCASTRKWRSAPSSCRSCARPAGTSRRPRS